MKPLVYILTLLISLQAVAQGVNELSLQSDLKEVLIELNSIEHIELHSSVDSQRIAIKYENTDETTTPILYEKQGTIHIKVPNRNEVLQGVEKNKYRAGQPLFPKYRIVVPHNSNVQLFYEKGNAKVTNFIGELALHISSGTIAIEQFKGKVDITSFSGKINCFVKAASINVVTNKGVLNSLLRDENLIEEKQSIKGIYKNAKNVLNIRTIHAKVTLKPMVTRK